MTEKEAWLQKLEKIGVDHVRRDLETGIYTGSRKSWTNEWLAKFDRAQREDDEEFRRETKATARSAKNAAWAAAIAAIIAAIAAIVSLVIAFSGSPPA